MAIWPVLFLRIIYVSFSHLQLLQMPRLFLQYYKQHYREASLEN